MVDDTGVDKAHMGRLRRAILRGMKTPQPGGPFDKKLRAAIVAHAQLRLTGGERVADIAESLAINGDTSPHDRDPCRSKGR